MSMFCFGIASAVYGFWLCICDRSFHPTCRTTGTEDIHSHSIFQLGVDNFQKIFAFASVREKNCLVSVPVVLGYCQALLQIIFPVYTVCILSYLFRWTSRVLVMQQTGLYILGLVLGFCQRGTLRRTAVCYTGVLTSVRQVGVYIYCSVNADHLFTLGTGSRVARWFSELAAMAMLSVRIWVRVPPTTSGVFLL